MFILKYILLPAVITMAFIFGLIAFVSHIPQSPNNPIQYKTVTITVTDIYGLPIDSAAIAIDNTISIPYTKNGLASINIPVKNTVYNFVVAKKDFKTFNGVFDISKQKIMISLSR